MRGAAAKERRVVGSPRNERRPGRAGTRAARARRSRKGNPPRLMELRYLRCAAGRPRRRRLPFAGGPLRRGGAPRCTCSTIARRWAARRQRATWPGLAVGNEDRATARLAPARSAWAADKADAVPASSVEAGNNGSRHAGGSGRIDRPSSPSRPVCCGRRDATGVASGRNCPSRSRIRPGRGTPAGGAVRTHRP